MNTITVRISALKTAERPVHACFTHMIDGARFDFAVTGYEPTYYVTHLASGFAVCKARRRKRNDSLNHAGVYALLMYLEVHDEKTVREKLMKAEPL